MFVWSHCSALFVTTPARQQYFHSKHGPFHPTRYWMLHRENYTHFSNVFFSRCLFMLHRFSSIVVTIIYCIEYICSNGHLLNMAHLHFEQNLLSFSELSSGFWYNYAALFFGFSMFSLIFSVFFFLISRISHGSHGENLWYPTSGFHSVKSLYPIRNMWEIQIVSEEKRQNASFGTTYHLPDTKKITEKKKTKRNRKI